MHCRYFEQARCRSCSEIATPYATQLAAKAEHARRALALHQTLHWLSPLANAERGFRNKAKMMVAGSVDAPTLGILDGDYHGIDLAECPLYPPQLAVAFEPLRAFIQRAALQPYAVNQRRGELKHLLLTLSDAPGQPLMLRFVCRSREPESRLRKHLPWLQQQLPQLRVVSLNLLPQHAAASEGDVEVLLSKEQDLPMPINDLPLYLRPGGFFQTSTDLAAALYRQAQDWIVERQPASVLDLFCGVGGFAVHAAAALAESTSVLGIEISADAIACAHRSAHELGRGKLQFQTLDAEQTPNEAIHAAELIVVNPPRRGIGAALCAQLESSPARGLIYSSCNVDSLASDLKRMPSWRAREARVLDLFPHTRHFETLVFLERSA